MLYTRTVKENLRFLVFEVTKQVEDTVEVIKGNNGKLVEKILDREEYVDILKSLVINQCFARHQDPAQLEQKDLDLMRAIYITANNLEHISDFLVNIVGQIRYLSDLAFFQQYQYKPFFQEIFGAIGLIDRALFNRDINQALIICRSEFQLDDLFRAVFHTIMENLRFGRETENLVTTLFMFRYLERIGDSLLNIGEAIISVVVGENLKIHQYQALEESLKSSEISLGSQGLSFQAYSETRSGLRVGKVEGRGETKRAQRVIFKEGRLKKLIEEKEAIEKWHRLFPGLAPSVFGFQRFGENGALLLEYMGEETFQSVLLHRDVQVLDEALEILTGTLRRIWTETRIPDPVNASFLHQLAGRLADVYKVHPYFRRDPEPSGATEIPSYEELLQEAMSLEEQAPAPFSVFIHGDFNLDNIIFNKESRRIYFIDLHRSAYQDYVQDISVFLVSHFRLPVFDSAVRKKLDHSILKCLDFSRSFARDSDDPTFEIRLGLGLVRSLATSTRFELKEDFARVMFRHSRFLLEHILQFMGKPWEDYHIPLEALLS
ncbi:MAG TPA: PhoU domain-containing protein [Atribacteraceae bacterium]|nr:PhoU domain-containing protein [Atribacteraceae bacterium]